MCPVARAALPGAVQRVKAAVGEVVFVPVTVVASPRCISHDVGDVGEEFGFLVKMNGQAHAGVERGVGRVEVVVPKFVTRVVSIGRQIKDKSATLTQTLVRSFYQFQGGVDGITRQSGDEKEPVFLPRERLHRFSSERSIIVRNPVISADGTVVGAAKQRQFLVKTGLIVAARYTQWNAFRGYEVVESVHRGSVLQHLKEGGCEEGVELISIDRLACWRARSVEQEHTVK